MKRHPELTARDSNVYVLADEATAAFFAAAGANALDPREVDAEVLFEYLELAGCELLLVSEDLWADLRKQAEKVTFPPVVLIPALGGRRGEAARRLRNVSERALGIDVINEGEATTEGGAGAGDEE